MPDQFVWVVVGFHISDFVIILDILFGFLTGKAEEDGSTVMDPSVIAGGYLQSWSRPAFGTRTSNGFG